MGRIYSKKESLREWKCFAIQENVLFFKYINYYYFQHYKTNSAP